VTAMFQVAGGFVAPVQTAWQRVGELVDEVIEAVVAREPCEAGSVDHEFQHVHRVCG